MPTIAEYLKFANIQMAAEALFGYEAVSADPNQPSPVLVPNAKRLGAIDPAWLTTGNLHASKFSEAQANEFVDPVTGWKVVEHISNTTTGFSGTLFKNNQTGELVLSFRSTEFIDDAARDNEATNKLEINEKGWAFGQLSDMESWYQSLKSRNLIDGQISVTGYSLGGHLATAFNLMHGGEVLGPSMPMLIKQVVTFNGAGVGAIGSNSAADIERLLPMIQSFSGLLSEARDSGLGRLLQTDLGKSAYQTLKSVIYVNGGVPSSAMVNSLFAQFNRQMTPATQADYLLLNGALSRILDVYDEGHRAPGMPSGGNPANPARIPDASIAGESLDYQLAVLVTARDYQTSSLSYLSGALAITGPKVSGAFAFTNQFDVVGTEMANATVYDMVSHSQYHYGQDVPLFIEDQPLTRGNATWEVFLESAKNLGLKLLVPGYTANDFGDTHSLVLLVDSLSVMNAMGRLDNTLNSNTLADIFKSATAATANRTNGTQGTAEGDALENVVDALAGIFTGNDSLLRAGLELSDGTLLDPNDGNTWANASLRTPFHQTLAAIAASTAYKQALGKIQFVPVSSDGTTARDDFGQFLSLYYLAPFQIKTTDPSVSALLKAANERLAQDWEADAALSTNERTAGKATYSDQWLNDRAAMASWLVAGNTANAETLARANVTGAWDFNDAGTGKEISVQKLNGNFTSIERHKILFGSDTWDADTGGADQLTGNEQSDHLYGMSDNDILQGKGGDDTLEGGKHDDILIGGKDNDILNGGGGYDSYVWESVAGTRVLGFIFGASNDGDDTILDADRRGRILINGSGVKLLIKSGSDWKSPDGKITLTQGETWKLAIDGGGSLDLGAAFNDGDYGIHRTDIADGGPIIRGDLDPILDGDGNLQNDGRGNLIVSTTEAAGREDRLYGSENTDTLRGLAGNDIINGNGGHDLIEGGTGRDILIGDVGNDTEWGGAALATGTPLATALASGNTDISLGTWGDWVDGQAGNDLLIGSTAKDLLSGGADNDLLIGGAGDDLLLGNAALQQADADWSVTRLVHDNDTNYRYQINQGVVTGSDSIGGADALYGGAGDDWAFGGAGDDLVDGASGNDVLFGDAGNDVVLGGTGNDILNGDNANLDVSLQGNDWLDGGAGNDRIFGMAGDDVIIGGKGDDIIVGGAGRDTYIFNKGDGIDQIHDDDTGDEKSILVFGEGFDKDSIKLRKGSLLLDMGDGDAIHIDNFDPNNALGMQSVASFQFADGSSLTWAELLARGFDLDGTAGDDSIVGTGIEDRIDGKGGKDLIWAGEGNDLLTGGTGTDGLNGGLGDDTYVFNAGDGTTLDGTATGVVETLVDAGGNDTIRFAGDVDTANLRLLDNRDGSLVIDYAATGQPLDRLLVDHGLAGTIEHIAVGAGDTAANDTEWRVAA